MKLVLFSDALNHIYAQVIPSIQLMIQRMQLNVGDYKLTSRTQDINAWLICDGRSLSRTAYAELFEVIGTTFGADDAETFKLPDFRGRVVGQPGHGVGLTNRNIGDAVGEETHTLSAAEMPSHTHSGTTNTTGGHTHTASAAANGAHTHTINDPGHTHTQTTINDDFNNSGSTPPGFTADSAGSQTWNNINSSTTGITVNSAGSHTHAITVDDSGSHSHTFTTAAAGSGGAHNNMQPTLFGANMLIFTGKLM